jgi:hypothetical protein
MIASGSPCEYGRAAPSAPLPSIGELFEFEFEFEFDFFGVEPRDAVSAPPRLRLVDTFRALFKLPLNLPDGEEVEEEEEEEEEEEALLLVLFFSFSTAPAPPPPVP